MSSFRPDSRFAANPALFKHLMPSSHPSFNRDEGYSEDTRSQSGSDAAFRIDSNMEDSMDEQQMLPDWFLTMPEDTRAGLFGNVFFTSREY
jgi:F-box and WD-40 domain protein 1/11